MRASTISASFNVLQEDVFLSMDRRGRILRTCVPDAALWSSVWWWATAREREARVRARPAQIKRHCPMMEWHYWPLISLESLCFHGRTVRRVRETEPLTGRHVVHHWAYSRATAYRQAPSHLRKIIARGRRQWAMVRSSEVRGEGFISAAARLSEASYCGHRGKRCLQ